MSILFCPSCLGKMAEVKDFPISRKCRYCKYPWRVFKFNGKPLFRPRHPALNLREQTVLEALRLKLGASPRQLAKIIYPTDRDGDILIVGILLRLQDKKVIDESLSLL